MNKTMDPIDVFVGEASDGHAELVAASLRETGIVENLHRGRNGAETMSLVRGMWRSCRNLMDRPAVVLLDCGLPRAGSAGVLRALKRNRQSSWIPVIMMTTVYCPQQAERFRRLGCDAYVTKWAVFLGMPDFGKRMRLLANRAICSAANRPSERGGDGSGASTLDLRCIPENARSYHFGRACTNKELKDDCSTP